MGSVIFDLVVWALIIGIPLMWWMSRKKRKEEFAALPPEGPMRVNISTAEVPAGSFNSKRLTNALVIDVKISQKDWRSIAAMGLMRHTLFEYPGPSGNMYDPENVRPFRVEDLKQKNNIGFNNIQQLEEAREQLIQGLRTLRARIDEQQEGPRTESFEL